MTPTQSLWQSPPDWQEKFLAALGRKVEATSFATVANENGSLDIKLGDRVITTIQFDFSRGWGVREPGSQCFAGYFDPDRVVADVAKLIRRALKQGTGIKARKSMQGYRLAVVTDWADASLRVCDICKHRGRIESDYKMRCEIGDFVTADHGTCDRFEEMGEL